MSSSSTTTPLEVRLEREGDVAIAVFDNPARLNPLTTAFQQQLGDALRQVADDRSVRALVLTGAGRAFCSGADLSGSGPGGQADDGRSRGQRSEQWMKELSNPLILALRECPVPVVSAVNGPCAGAGVGVALAADVMVMARSAYLYLPFMVKLGIVPDLGTTWFLERAIGRQRAMALTLLGDRLGAEQALAWGLAHAVADDAELRPQAVALAQRLAKLPAHAAVESRRAYDAAAHHSLARQLDYEAERQRELLDKPSFVEGVMAFMGKREPRFDGR